MERVIAHVQEQRVAAAREQAEERRLERIVAEEEGSDVRVQVVDRDERQPASPRDRLRRAQADEERAGKPGPARDRDPLDVVEGPTRFGERFIDRRDDEFEVPARGDLGDDTAEPRVQLGLRRDDVGEDATVAGYERGRGLVTRGLETEDQVATRCVSSAGGGGLGPPQPTSAS